MYIADIKDVSFLLYCSFSFLHDILMCVFCVCWRGGAISNFKINVYRNSKREKISNVWCAIITCMWFMWTKTSKFLITYQLKYSISNCTKKQLSCMHLLWSHLFPVHPGLHPPLQCPVNLSQLAEFMQFSLHLFRQSFPKNPGKHSATFVSSVQCYKFLVGHFIRFRVNSYNIIVHPQKSYVSVIYHLFCFCFFLQNQ